MQNVICHDEFVELLVGKTIKNLNTYSHWGQLCVSDITFTDGTSLELGVVCEEVRLNFYETEDSYKLPEVVADNE